VRLDGSHARRPALPAVDSDSGSSSGGAITSSGCCGLQGAAEGCEARHLRSKLLLLLLQAVDPLLQHHHLLLRAVGSLARACLLHDCMGKQCGRAAWRQCSAPHS
jgi:hypothetical protein